MKTRSTETKFVAFMAVVVFALLVCTQDSSGMDGGVLPMNTWVRISGDESATMGSVNFSYIIEIPVKGLIYVEVDPVNIGRQVPLRNDVKVFPIDSTATGGGSGVAGDDFFKGPEGERGVVVNFIGGPGKYKLSANAYHSTYRLKWYIKRSYEEGQRSQQAQAQQKQSGQEPGNHMRQGPSNQQQAFAAWQAQQQMHAQQAGQQRAELMRQEQMRREQMERNQAAMQGASGYPIGIATAGDGLFRSPYNNGYVDCRGEPPGGLVKDSDGRLFLVPTQSQIEQMRQEQIQREQMQRNQSAMVSTPSPPPSPSNSSQESVVSCESAKITGGEKNDAGFAWRNMVVSASANEITVSFDFKVWNDSQTPITQLFLCIGNKVHLTLYNGVPNAESVEGWRSVKRSFKVDLQPSIIHKMTLVQTQEYSIEDGIKNIEVRGGSTRHEFGTLTTK
jgi:hypothetical protein